MGILTGLLYTLIITFPLGVVIRIRITEFAYVYPVDIILSLITCYVFFLYLSKRIHLHPIIKSVGYFLIWCLATLFINSFWLGLQHMLVAGMYLIRFSFFSSLLVAFLYTPASFRRQYLYAMYIAGVLFVLLGFIQYFFYPFLGFLTYQGWDEHYYRIFSTFLDPNFAGAAMVLQLILIMYLLSTKQGKYARVSLLASAVLTLIAIFLTYSRVTYLMLAFAIPTFFVLIKQYKLIVIALLIIVVGLIIIPKDRKSDGVDLLRTQSITRRLMSYQNAFTVWSSSPVYGSGFNALRYAQEREQLLKKSIYGYESHSDAGVPNSYLFVLATTGIVGLLIFLNIFRVIVSTVWKNLASLKHKHTSVLVFVSTSAVLVGSLTENILFFSSILLWFFALVGLYIADLKKTKDGS